MDGGPREVVQFTGVVELSDDQLSYAMGYADYIFDEKNKGHTVEHTVMYESVTGFMGDGDLDFKTKLTELFGIQSEQNVVIDGVMYNKHEAGNYLWGMALEARGSLIDAGGLAETATQIMQSRSDEPHEQKAIAAGAEKAKMFLGE